MEPRREVLAEGVEVWLGDMRDVLPTLGVFDACVTDPPYGIKRDGKPKSTSSHGGHKGYAFKGWDQKRPDKHAFDLMLSASKAQVIWGGNYFSDYLPPRAKWLVWDKGQRIDQADGELAFTSEPGALRIFTQNRVALLVEGAQHPTQKPLEIMRWSLLQLPQAQRIVDPFMGSGTTGVAAVNLGRYFTGIEGDPGYFDIACKRISAALREPDMFIATPQPKAEQLSILDGAA